MELRKCTPFHFIQAIRSGWVEKVLNVSFHGRPSLRFKKVEDIYESEQAKKCDSLSTLQPQDSYSDMDFNNDSVKTKGPCTALMERKIKERGINTNISYCNSDDDAEDEEGTNSLSSEKMTLNQLKERCRTKKRKALCSLYLSPKQGYTDLHPAEDECDLDEPISTWIMIAKNPRGKTKRVKKCSLSPQIEVSTSDQVLSAEDLMQCSPYLPVPSVKVDVSETKYVECRDMTCSADETSNFYGEQEICTVRPELESEEIISFTTESQSCIVNDVCFDHLEHTQLSHLLPSIIGETADAEKLRKTCQRSLNFPTSEDKEGHTVHLLLEKSSPETNFPLNDQGSYMYNCFQSNSSVHEISRKKSGVCGVQVPDMAMDSSFCCVRPKSASDHCNLEDDINRSYPPNLEMDSLSSSFCNYTTSSDSTPFSDTEIVFHSADDDLLATGQPPLMCISVDTARDFLSPHKNQVDFEGGSTTKEEKPPLKSSLHDSESNSSEKDHLGDDVYKSSIPEINDNYHVEQGHFPERLLSTRKAISPTSQEKLCQAMKIVESDQMIDHDKNKDRLQFTEDTLDNASPTEPIVVAEVNANKNRMREVNRTFVAMRPKQMTNQPENDRKGSLPKGFRRVPPLSRSRLHVSNGPTSIQSCSERAIAFSQRQMHDIEGLATKLMHELKSMKDIIEGQVHSEDYAPTSLKYDVDEVKATIKSATKTEETTRKWLSMMTRDCTRFCKLMRLNENGEIGSGNPIHKERKKITFADEAGGVLCHVKFIEDSIASADS